MAGLWMRDTTSCVSAGGQQVTVDFDGGLDKVPKELQEEVADLYQSHMDGLTKFAAAFRKKGR